MEEQSLYKYFMFGWDYHLLYQGTPPSNQDAIEILDEFEDTVKEYSLVVTQKASKTQLSEIKKKLQNLDDLKGKIPANLLSELHNFCKKIDVTLDSELRLRRAYILTPKRLGLENLQKNISQLFAENIFNNLSDQAQKDFSEAGKCLAFERYTASAFHILRGTEDALRNYYLNKVKKNRVKPLLWDKIVKDLCTKKNIPKGLLAVLDSIREDFRNPTAHPEKFYGEDEVQSLFTHCIDVVNRIYKEMSKNK